MYSPVSGTGYSLMGFSKDCKWVGSNPMTNVLRRRVIAAVINNNDLKFWFFLAGQRTQTSVEKSPIIVSGYDYAQQWCRTRAVARSNHVLSMKQHIRIAQYCLKRKLLSDSVTDELRMTSGRLRLAQALWLNPCLLHCVA